MGAFRSVFLVSVLAVGCGGRTAYDGSGSGSTGSVDGSAGNEPLFVDGGVSDAMASHVAPATPRAALEPCRAVQAPASTSRRTLATAGRAGCSADHHLLALADIAFVLPSAPASV